MDPNDTGSVQDLQNFHNMFNTYVVRDVDDSQPPQDFSGQLPVTFDYPISAVDVMTEMFSSQ